MSDGPIKRIELRNGKVRYRFVLDVGRDPKTGKRQQKTFTFDGKREAEREYTRIKAEVNQGTYVRPNKITVGEWLDQWLASATRGLEEATESNYRKALLPVRERLGAGRLQKLQEGDVEAMVDWMLTSGRRTAGKPGTSLSTRYVELSLGRLKAALDVAVRRQLVGRNVAAYVVIPRTARREEAQSRPKRAPWTAEEVQTFLGAIRSDRLYAPMLLSLMGLRPAEVCGLRWIDVDLDAGTIAAGRNTRTMVDGRVVEKHAKSTSGDRGLPLPSPALDSLRSFKLRQEAEASELGAGYRHSGYVLVDQEGQPQKTDWLRRRAYDLMIGCQMRKVRLYDARHSCLTYLAANGVPDSVLAAWAGHSDGGALAKRVYVHPDASHLRVAADRLGELLG
ncbi:MAG TPA: tyrosine-type recombinase/integrase [Streptomyces sp.]|uniref:tyrosine-type recombinase/integrase n=1 Tax=Streptomyces sp. TaxID=1931 RepID=UPI002CA135A5|nr:tyrosine-type recombinase/integrase [Streptomyces sp.]HWU12120.1 tyrosine-type recombinase/integrase [Streptomyces sp.]